MLTSFFSKSKPINLFAIIFLMLTFYISASFSEPGAEGGFFIILKKIGVALALTLSLLVLNFIAKKNELTKRSAFKILLFAISVICFWPMLQNDSIIIANLFLLLALRRIISMRTQKDVQKKIFDASFWIAIASLYQFGAVLFFILIFFAILNFSSTLKNWLIPFVAFGAVAILTVTFHLFTYDSFYTFSDYYEVSNFDFSGYKTLRILVPLGTILFILGWSLINYVSAVQKASIMRRPVLNLVLFSLFIAMAVALFSPTKDSSELIFFMVPFSIIASNFFEKKKNVILKNILLGIFLVLPFIVLALD
ncbi:DUF6427 family protein [Gramella sp. AN32]|uniref:DUF6427 family protein n=1 Tax=Christiangramia antarctica TaxID=2058158 RepID=A0ABW5WZU0_9FLAO|nr:DUF6427 family protein [Gramella sp. AN32]MCM4155024.1 hypothetical protein [Gramella sp. AN32]